MTKKTRRRFTPDDKEHALARLSEPGVTYASLSAELGMTSGQLKTWHLELLAAGSATAIAQTKAEAAELAQLRRDVKRLREEHEGIRKTTKTRGSFPTYDAATKLVYLAVRNCEKAYRCVRHWVDARNQRAVQYPERFNR